MAASVKLANLRTILRRSRHVRGFGGGGERRLASTGRRRVQCDLRRTQRAAQGGRLIGIRASEPIVRELEVAAPCRGQRGYRENRRRLNVEPFVSGLELRLGLAQALRVAAFRLNVEHPGQRLTLQVPIARRLRELSHRHEMLVGALWVVVEPTRDAETHAAAPRGQARVARFDGQPRGGGGQPCRALCIAARAGKETGLMVDQRLQPRIVLRVRRSQRFANAMRRIAHAVEHDVSDAQRAGQCRLALG